MWGASWGVASAGSRGPAARAAPWTDGLMRVGRPRPRPGADPATWGLSRTPSQHVPSARVGWALGPAAAGASGWIFGAARVRRSSRCRWLASRGAAAGGMGGTPSGADSSRRERRAASTARVGEAPAPRARSARGRPLQRRGRGPWEAGGSVLAWVWGRARPGQEPVSVGGGRTTACPGACLQAWGAELGGGPAESSWGGSR